MFNRPAGIRNNNGIVLLLVILVVFIVTLLAGVSLVIMRSNSRNSFHKINRIKAYYAVNAAMVFTREQLRTGAWAAGNYAICPTAALCAGVPAANQFIDADMSYRVDIIVGNVGSGLPGTNTRLITLTTDYTYTE
jgi:Tfp pilus assembly protein PilX